MCGCNQRCYKHVSMVVLPRSIRIILVIQLVLGGLAGFGASVAGLFSSRVHGIVLTATVTFAAVLYAAVFLAGLALWHKPTELRPVLWGCAAQIPWVSLPGIVYKFVILWHWTFTVVLNHAANESSLAAKTNFSVLTSFLEWRVLGDADVAVGVNLYALAMFLYLRQRLAIANDPNIAESDSPNTALRDPEPGDCLPS